MQTLIVHSRRPIRLCRELGAASNLRAVALLIAGALLGGLFGPMLLLETLGPCLSRGRGRARAPLARRRCDHLYPRALGLSDARRSRCRRDSGGAAGGVLRRALRHARLLRAGLARYLGGAVRTRRPALLLEQDRTWQDAKRAGDCTRSPRRGANAARELISRSRSRSGSAPHRAHARGQIDARALVPGRVPAPACGGGHEVRSKCFSSRGGMKRVRLASTCRSPFLRLAVDVEALRDDQREIVARRASSRHRAGGAPPRFRRSTRWRDRRECSRRRS